MNAKQKSFSFIAKLKASEFGSQNMCIITVRNNQNAWQKLIPMAVRVYL